MKKIKIVAVAAAFLALTLFVCAAPSLAKYISEGGKQAQGVSAPFYFTSDYLDEDGDAEYRVYGDSVSFAVKNNADALRFCAGDVEYTASATAGVLSSYGGTLAGGSATGVTLTLTYDGGEPDKEIVVTVKSGAPYEKELTAKFIFTAASAEYEIEDYEGSYYATLYIYTENDDKTVNLLWNKETLLIDETNDYVAGNLNGDKTGATVTAPAHTTVKIAFFKNDKTKDYSCGKTKFDSTVDLTAAGS